jgi:hypothetical protein
VLLSDTPKGNCMKAVPVLHFLTFDAVTIQVSSTLPAVDSYHWFVQPFTRLHKSHLEVDLNLISFATFHSSNRMNRDLPSLHILPSYSIILRTIQCICSIVQCLCLDPNWWSGINPLFSTIGSSYFKRSFSETLHTMSNRLIGIRADSFQRTSVFPCSSLTSNP